MIRLSDFLIKSLADYGVKHVFMLTGGGAMFLNDSIKKEKRIKYICNHHEQACAMAAEAYARISGNIGVINVTTGPGGINALNGVFGAWTDSIPMLIISGQVKRETCMATYKDLHLRQLGDQEADIINMVKGITKYAVLIVDPKSIRYHLEKALKLAASGRPGPCWLDIPVDVQSSMIDESGLLPYDSSEDAPKIDMGLLKEQCKEVLSRIKRSARPVILAGSGIRLAKAERIFEFVIRKLGIPLTTAWTGLDLVSSDDPLYCGRPGSVGDRAGNFTVQNSDLLLILGSRLSIRQVSYNWKSFAREAYKIQIDADAEETKKPTVNIDMPITCDIRLFLEELNRQIDDSNYDKSSQKKWLKWCKERISLYPVLLPRQISQKKKINPYHFYNELFNKLDAKDIIACANGAASVIPFQVSQIKKGQRLFTNAGAASMGYELPAAIGAAFASDRKRIICLAGDGSIQLNIQELQTIIHHRLPVKIFILNNGGYLSIRTTQKNFFKGNFIGEGPESGLSFPDIQKIGKAYGFKTMKIDRPNFAPLIDKALKTKGPILCEVIVSNEQIVEPRMSSKQLPDGRIVSPPLEDMYPFLSREEFKKNLLIPEWVQK